MAKDNDRPGRNSLSSNAAWVMARHSFAPIALPHSFRPYSMASCPPVLTVATSYQCMTPSTAAPAWTRESPAGVPSTDAPVRVNYGALSGRTS